MKLLILINTTIQNTYEQALIIAVLTANLFALYYLSINEIRELLKL